MGLLWFFLPPNAAAWSERWEDMSLSWFEPTSVELHQTVTYEGRSTDWAIKPQQIQQLILNQAKTIFVEHAQNWGRMMLNLFDYCNKGPLNITPIMHEPDTLIQKNGKCPSSSSRFLQIHEKARLDWVSKCLLLIGKVFYKTWINYFRYMGPWF